MDLRQDRLESLVFDLSNRTPQPRVSGGQSTTKEDSPDPKWTGILIPGATTALPALATDWDSYFDDYSVTTYRCDADTASGELQRFVYFEPGDIRHRITFECKQAMNVPAYLFFGGTSTAPAAYDVQLKLNGVLTTYTAAVGAVSRNAITLKLVKGRNVLSIARRLGTQIADLYCSFLGDFATFVKE